MAAPLEVLLTSETSGDVFSICAWDPASGTQLTTFKGGSSAARTLCLLNGDFILSAVCNRHLIHLWSLHRKDQIQQRMSFPGQVSALATSPDGQYCVAGIEEKLHVWQVATGNLLAVISRHYQKINCVQFTDDGSHFVSGGEDNQVLVWSLARILSEASSQGAEPRFLWSHHSLPVTDIFVGHGAVNARVLSASLDQTVRMWDLSSGLQVCSFIFDHPIVSTVMDPAELRLFAGSTNGSIYQINLFEMPSRLERHITQGEDGTLSFSGHSKQVTCLSVSLDGSMLASGSHDNTVRLWDIASRQCVKTLSHKGAITNVQFVLTPKKMLSHDVTKSPCVMPKSFKRYLHGSQRMRQEQGDVTEAEGSVSVKISLSEDKPNPAKISAFLEEACLSTLKEGVGENQDPSEVQQDLKEEINNLKQVNKSLYNFAVNHIIENADGK